MALRFGTDLGIWFDEAKQDGNPYLALWLALQFDQEVMMEMFTRNQTAYMKEFSRRATIGRDRFTVRRELTAKYAWAVPCRAALDLLANHAPLVEVGAGTGYWAWLLRQRGVDILAFDEDPPGQDATNHWHRDNPCWTAIERGGPEAIMVHPGRTLFLCWPPYDTPMGLDCVRAYAGDKIIVVGEHGGCTGDEAFWLELETKWKRITEVDLPQFDGLHDFMMVYERQQE
jgi:hypothetical protein